MGDKKILLKVVTPDRTVVNAPVDMVGAVGTEGAFTALPGHIDFLTALKADEVWYRQEGQLREIAVSGGFIEVGPSQISVLADTAEYLEEIDVERARAAKQRAEEELENMMAKAKAAAQNAQDSGRAEITQAAANLTRAANRLKLAGKRPPR